MCSDVSKWVPEKGGPGLSSSFASDSLGNTLSSPVGVVSS